MSSNHNSFLKTINVERYHQGRLLEGCVLKNPSPNEGIESNLTRLGMEGLVWVPNSGPLHTSELCHALRVEMGLLI